MKVTNHSSIEIKNGQRLNSNGDWEPSTSIQVDNGYITKIDDQESATLSTHASISIDANDCYIVPGLIDLNVALREPGSTRNGTIASETLAAASSGITKLCCTPNTLPVNDSKAVTQLILEQTESNGSCQVLPLGALTKNLEGEHLASYAALKDAGCVALSNAFNPVRNLLVTQRCFEYARSHNMLVMINPIEPSLHQGYMHEGELSTQLGLQGVPSAAESIAVAQLIELAKSTGVRLHLSQLSCAGSVELVKSAKEKGLTITCDVAITQLLFTDAHVGYFDSLYHAMPPFRGSDDQAALIKGVLDGTIDAITSAHQPWEAAEKRRPFAETQAGLSTIELIIPMALKLEEQGIPLQRFIDCMTTGPAQVLGISPSVLEVGNSADLFVLNPTKGRQTNWHSLGTNMPLGSDLSHSLNGDSKVPIGRSELTLCNGKVSYYPEDIKTI